MKALDYLLAGLLTLTAGLQYNDPDLAYWIIVYGLGASVPLLHALGRNSFFLPAVAIGMTLAGMLYSVGGFFDYLSAGDFASITGSMDGPNAYVEPAREFIGLAIQMGIVGWYAWKWRTGAD